MQKDGDRHETTPSPLLVAPRGPGLGTIVHFFPFHRSAKTPESDPPTAMHAEGDAQETAFRDAPGTVGMGWPRQRVPFHCRASVDATPRVGPAVPTAMHRSVAGQAIPLSWFSAAPIGLGTACRCHRPFRHRSPSGNGVPSPLPWPTAVQSDGEGQDTPLRKLVLARAGLAAGWACQAFPFHRSPSGTNAPELPAYPPTASHEETAQETLNN